MINIRLSVGTAGAELVKGHKAQDVFEFDDTLILRMNFIQ